MEEQTIQQAQQEQTTNISVPEDVPVTENQVVQEEIEEPEIAIQDGEVKFSDKFFSDVKTEPESSEIKETSQTTRTEENTTQNYYTDEELQNIPYEQWDKSRLPKEVATYYDAVSKQLAQRQLVVQPQKPVLPNFVGEAPKQFTAHELAEKAREIAAKKLGITDMDDFDPDYDEEHRAALDLARYEILQRLQGEQALYNQRVQEMNELDDFNAQLVKMPDFVQFDTWYRNTLQKIGKTAQEVNAGLYEIAKQYGGREVIRQVSNWYQRYKQETANSAPKLQQKTRQVRQSPIKLESTRGNYEGRRSYNMREFSQLDDDAQAKALIEMGIV